VTHAGAKGKEKVDAVVFQSFDDQVVLADGKPVVKSSERVKNETVTVERTQRKMKVTVHVKSPIARAFLGLPPLKK
jgi:hypothetical protein